MGKRELGTEVRIYRQSKKDKGTTKQPIFKILCLSGKSDTCRAYTSLAATGYLHSMVKDKDKE